MAWARHGKCESDTAALCKSNGKDTFQTLSGKAWQGNGMGTTYVWIGLNETTDEYSDTDSFRLEPFMRPLKINERLYGCRHLSVQA